MVERLFYPLAMLAERWGCSVGDLLHLGLRDKAQICVNIYGVLRKFTRTRWGDGESTSLLEDASQTDKERQEAEVRDKAFGQWVPRTKEDMPDGVFEVMHDDIRWITRPHYHDSYDLSQVLKFDSGKWWKYKFSISQGVFLRDLCILHAEAERLGGEEFNTTPAPAAVLVDTTQDNDPSDLPLELDAAMIAFRAVSNGYGDPLEKFKSRLIAYLRENYPNLSDEAVGRISIVANADKSPGRKGAQLK